MPVQFVSGPVRVFPPQSIVRLSPVTFQQSSSPDIGIFNTKLLAIFEPQGMFGSPGSSSVAPPVTPTKRSNRFSSSEVTLLPMIGGSVVVLKFVVLVLLMRFICVTPSPLVPTNKVVPSEAISTASVSEEAPE